jgi:hypothetical protein
MLENYALNWCILIKRCTKMVQIGYKAKPEKPLYSGTCLKGIAGTDHALREQARALPGLGLQAVLVRPF